MARVLMMTDFTESYGNKLLQGIIKYSHEHSPWVVGKIPLSFRDGNQLKTAAEIADHWKADAIIGQFRSFEDIRPFQERGIIPVAQDFLQSFPGIINITGDYLEAGRMAARYFMERGLRHFAYYGLNGVVWSDGRRDGFMEVAARDAGAPLRKSDIREIKNLKTSWWYNTEKLIHWLRSLPKPVGIYCCDDNKAYNIIEACSQSQQTGLRIPEDILLLGTDNDETVCQLCMPQLSSVALDVEIAGYQVAALIEYLLNLPPKERSKHYSDIIVRPTHIVTHHSTDALVNDNPYISKILRYIENNIGKSLRVEDLVALVPMSRRTLEETFSKSMGTSIYRYIIQTRVSRFQKLILGGLSPSQAAMELGLEYKSLSREFKRQTGLSPKEFLSQAQ
ncbi:MAG: helix-turn-helix domain-containing protein [Bacteroidales bacterium]|nr:helix-turn-helix domain-containing protein [Bacteroidales bacterium]